MTTPKSNCCNADLRPICGGSGIGKYECAKCRKICDPASEPKPETEQDEIKSKILSYVRSLQSKLQESEEREKALMQTIENQKQTNDALVKMLEQTEKDFRIEMGR